VREEIKEIGAVHITMAKTRLKLIRGERSFNTKYENPH
jgi:uncharacterized protein YwlG (UPF0340 family)